MFTATTMFDLVSELSKSICGNDDLIDDIFVVIVSGQVNIMPKNKFVQ
jgi:hypothetical protein